MRHPSRILPACSLLREHRECQEPGVRRAHGQLRIHSNAFHIVNSVGADARRSRRRRRSRPRRRVDDSGAFFTFENTGTATSPVFVPRTGAANPLDGQDVGIFSSPAFGDLDGDGDPDLVSGELRWLLHFGFANRAGRFTPRTGSANPLARLRCRTPLGPVVRRSRRRRRSRPRWQAIADGGFEFLPRTRATPRVRRSSREQRLIRSTETTSGTALHPHSAISTATAISTLLVGRAGTEASTTSRTSAPAREPGFVGAWSG